MARDKRMYFMWIVLSVILIAVALVMLLKRDMFNEILTGTLSVFVLLSSLVSLFTIRRYQEIRIAFAGTLVKGISGLIIGVLALVLLFTGSPKSAHIMLKVLAAQTALASIILFIELFTLEKGKYPKRPILLEAFVSIVIAVLIFLLPAETASLLITLISAVAITVGIAGIIIGIVYLRSKEVTEPAPSDE